MIGLSVKLIHWHFTAANFCLIKLNLTNNFEYIISSFQYQKYQHFKTIKNIKFKSKKNSNTPKQPKISRFENKWLSIDISQLQFCFCPSCLVSLSGKCHLHHLHLNDFLQIFLVSLYGKWNPHYHHCYFSEMFFGFFVP